METTKVEHDWGVQEEQTFRGTYLDRGAPVTDVVRWKVTVRLLAAPMPQPTVPHAYGYRVEATYTDDAGKGAKFDKMYPPGDGSQYVAESRYDLTCHRWRLSADTLSTVNLMERQLYDWAVKDYGTDGVFEAPTDGDC